MPRSGNAACAGRKPAMPIVETAVAPAAEPKNARLLMIEVMLSPPVPDVAGVFLFCGVIVLRSKHRRSGNTPPRLSLADQAGAFHHRLPGRDLGIDELVELLEAHRIGDQAVAPESCLGLR